MLASRGRRLCGTGNSKRGDLQPRPSNANTDNARLDSNRRGIRFGDGKSAVSLPAFSNIDFWNTFPYPKATSQ